MKLFVQWEPLLPHVMFSNFERVLKGEHQLPDYPTVQDALDVRLPKYNSALDLPALVLDNKHVRKVSQKVTKLALKIFDPIHVLPALLPLSLIHI